MKRYVIKLYITGLTSRSQRAVATLQRLCESELAGRYELHIVDVLEQPELAEMDKILATPTVIKEHPEPQQRIIGDLSDASRVMAALDLGHFEPTEVPAPASAPAPATAPVLDSRAKEAD